MRSIVIIALATLALAASGDAGGKVVCGKGACDSTGAPIHTDAPPPPPQCKPPQRLCGNVCVNPPPPGASGACPAAPASPPPASNSATGW